MIARPKMEKIKRIELANPIIHFPVSGKSFYSIKNPFSNTGELSISLNISEDPRKKSNIYTMNVCNLFRSCKEDSFYFTNRQSPVWSVAYPCILSWEILPRCDDEFNNKRPPPVLVKHQGGFYALSALNVWIESDQIVKLTGETGSLLPNQDKYNNKLIEDRCRKLAGNMMVKTGPIPIIKADNCPDYNVLENLYKQFLVYNDDNKLLQQYKLTAGSCHIRAHFVSSFLDQYGIHSSKVFKYWNPESWQSYSHTAWHYHCAVMITTNTNEYVIWDPWVGLNHHLLSLNEWLYRHDEPTPTKLMICNKTVFFHQYDGGISTPVDNYQMGNNFSLWQFLCENTLPNRPEKPLKLSDQRATLFHQKRRLEALADQDQASVMIICSTH